MTPAQRDALQRDLLAWYRDHQRDLPWRATSDPYAVWVSEVMLQQTQVATVKAYFERWMRRFPTVAALADADADAVLGMWQGLGYYSRARRLQAGARAVIERFDGELPDTVEALLTLPGIGPYSAGAIASIAFGRPAPIVDGNVVRVLCRLFAQRGDPTRAAMKRWLWGTAGALVPARRPGDFNQALMELGATVCTPTGPRCATCPVNRTCAAHARGISHELPELRARPKAQPVLMVAMVATDGRRVLVERFAADAPRWAGMWHFPATEVSKGESAQACLERVAGERLGCRGEVRGLLTTLRHSVTRFRITLDVYRVSVPRADTHAAEQQATRLRWVAPDELAELALPAVHRRIADLIVDPGVLA